jgi:hypothetical protein
MKLGELIDAETELGKQWKGCVSKLNGFDDEKLALAEAHRVSSIVGVELYVYTCPHCSKFHFTKKERTARRPRKPKLALNVEAIERPAKVEVLKEHWMQTPVIVRQKKTRAASTRVRSI